MISLVILSFVDLRASRCALHDNNISINHTHFGWNSILIESWQSFGLLFFCFACGLFTCQLHSTMQVHSTILQLIKDYYFSWKIHSHSCNYKQIPLVFIKWNFKYEASEFSAELLWQRASWRDNQHAKKCGCNKRSDVHSICVLIVHEVHCIFNIKLHQIHTTE